MDVLKINYPEGCMEIQVDTFFPCSQDKLKKLIRLMSSVNKKDIEDLVNTLNEIHDYYESFRKGSVFLFHDCHQKMIEYQQMISEGKHPSGVPLTESELAELKYKVRENKREKERHHKEFTRCHNKQKKLQKNIETLVKLL